MKGEKRLKEIKERMERVLNGISPDSPNRYEIRYEPIKKYLGTSIPLSRRDNPAYDPNVSWAYQFLLYDKSKPKKTFRVMEVFWPDIAKKTQPYMEKYFGGSACEPRFREGIDFLNQPEENPRRKRKSKGLGDLLTVLMVVGFAGGIFFLFPKITGSVINNFPDSTSYTVGVVLLCASLIGGYFWMKKR